MSDLNTRATVTLSVNGQQAEKTLQMLKQNALDLETAIAKAASAGNKTDLQTSRLPLVWKVPYKCASRSPGAD